MTLKLPVNYVDIDREEMEYVDGGGTVGFRVHLASWILGIGALAGGAYVAGVVGWHCKNLAKAGPWGAGAAGAIAATAGGAAGWAIKNGLRTFTIGPKVPFINYVKLRFGK